MNRTKSEHIYVDLKQRHYKLLYATESKSTNFLFNFEMAQYENNLIPKRTLQISNYDESKTYMLKQTMHTGSQTQ